MSSQNSTKNMELNQKKRICTKENAADEQNAGYPPYKKRKLANFGASSSSSNEQLEQYGITFSIKSTRHQPQIISKPDKESKATSDGALTSQLRDDGLTGALLPGGAFAPNTNSASTDTALRGAGLRGGGSRDTALVPTASLLNINSQQISDVAIVGNTQTYSHETKWWNYTQSSGIQTEVWKDTQISVMSRHMITKIIFSDDDAELRCGLWNKNKGTIVELPNKETLSCVIPDVANHTLTRNNDVNLYQNALMGEITNMRSKMNKLKKQKAALIKMNKKPMKQMTIEQKLAEYEKSITMKEGLIRLVNKMNNQLTQAQASLWSLTMHPSVL